MSRKSPQDDTKLCFTPSEEETFKTKGYEIEKKLGEGTYATVFLCKKAASFKTVHLACKVIDTKNAPPDFVQKFLPRELEILIHIKHPHIIFVEGIFQRRSKYYLFMRFAEVGDLLDYIISKGRLSENRARFWTFQIVSAVQYLHLNNIVHRDIKCENVLITNSFNIKLCDFGFSRRVSQDFLSTTYCGSFAYSAPEILRGNPYDPKISDMWAVGVVLFVQLNRKLPFNESSNKKMIIKQAARAVSHVPTVESTLSMNVKNAVFMLLEPNPKSRWTPEKFFHSPWIAMDMRLGRYPNYEIQSINSERQAEGHGLLTTAKHRAAKEVSTVTVLKESEDISNTSLMAAVSELDVKKRADVSLQATVPKYEKKTHPIKNSKHLGTIEDKY